MPPQASCGPGSLLGVQGTGRGLAQPSDNPTLRLPGATLTFNERDIEGRSTRHPRTGLEMLSKPTASHCSRRKCDTSLVPDFYVTRQCGKSRVENKAPVRQTANLHAVVEALKAYGVQLTEDGGVRPSETNTGDLIRRHCEQKEERPRLMPRQSMLFKVPYADIAAMKNDMRSARHAMAAIMVA